MTQNKERIARVGLARKVRYGTNCFFVAALPASPYRKRSAPVALPGKCPILKFPQPLAKPPLLKMRGNPLDSLVPPYEAFLQLGHPNKPGPFRKIKKRGITSPTKGIIMFIG